jgi:hypothetical protein
MAMFFPPQYHRRLGDGRDWWDYAVTVALGPWPGGAPNLFMATRGLAQSMSDETPGLQRTKEQFIQTGWGPAMVTDLQAPTPFDYVEYTRLLTIQRPNGLALVVLQAPVSQFDGMLPLFDRVVNSLVFH